MIRSLLFLLLLLAGPAGAVDPRPNVLLITVDTFRPDHIGYYGYPHATSPHLDSIAAEGVFFKQAFSSSGWTSPGLISILSGLYAPTHGVDIRSQELDPGVTTLPEAFRAAGYAAPDIFFLTEIPNFGELGFEPYPSRDRYIHDGDQILFKWLAEEAPRHQPFFLYYHYRELHLPYDPKPPFDTLFMPEEYGPGFSPLGLYRKVMAGEKIAAVRKNVMLVRGDADFGEDDQPWVEALYDGQIRQLDEEFFGPLRQTLRDLGLDRNTIVVISADHGEELLDHGLVGHVSTFKEGRLFDEVIRIPLIFWYPAGLPAGRVVDEPVQCIDILPTLMELIGQPAPLGAQGASLVPLLRGQPGWKPRPIYCETSGGGYTADDEQYRQRVAAVRTERWKLVHYTPADEFALYDLNADPRETRDVLERHPQVADSLRTLLNQWLLFTQKRPYHRPPATTHPDAAAGPPQILFPADGDTLNYQGDGYSIELRWTGDPQVDYVIQYEVGKGSYHLEGEITETGTTPSYGPFQETFWNSISLYNPWRFRVYAQGQPEQASPWVTFYLASTHPTVSPSLGTWLWLALRGLQSGDETTVQLVRGLGLGGVDLYLWVAQIPPAELSAYALLLAILAALVWPLLLRWGLERSRAWGLALLYIAFVYSTIPLMPVVWRTLSEHTQGAVRYLGIGVVFSLGLALVLKARKGRAGRRWWTWVGLLGVGLAYAYLLQHFARFPAERLHLVEYGLVSYLLLRALSLDLPAPRAYIVALLLTALVGAGDELIQWVLPERVFEMKDVQLNLVSGILGLLAVRLSLHRDDHDPDDHTNRPA
ncbi:MAG: VanZ family protein [Candidatus Latescibacteria bacterium]|nr:VanZ family protein [Candidatus Latescibacterota bacterium]